MVNIDIDKEAINHAVVIVSYEKLIQTSNIGLLGTSISSL
jgi:hypothetical protein